MEKVGIHENLKCVPKIYEELVQECARILDKHLFQTHTITMYYNILYVVGVEPRLVIMVLIGI
jgi:hypothetical protein